MLAHLKKTSFDLDTSIFDGKAVKHNTVIIHDTNCILEMKYHTRSVNYRNTCQLILSLNGQNLKKKVFL
jgi:hypothetical protein